MQPGVSRVLMNPNATPLCLCENALAFTLCLSKIAQGAVVPYFIPLAFNVTLAKNRWISYCIKSSIMACDCVFNEGGWT